MLGVKSSALSLTAVALLLAGCASAPEQPTENRIAAESGGSADGGDAVAPSRVIDLSATADLSDSTVICRDMLKQGSNVIVTRCMTRADWEEFKRRQARDAQEFVRMLQGGGYR